MPICETCGQHVSKRFATVVGDNENRIDACVSCGEGRCAPTNAKQSTETTETPVRQLRPY